MKLINNFQQIGVPSALGAAILFGVGTPLAKVLLMTVNPWMMAGLLYLGSGIGLGLYRFYSKATVVKMCRNEVLWFAGAIVTGGIIGPVLLMLGLVGMPASGVSLLLNAEGVLTALLAWLAFKENFDLRILIGMALIVTGVVVLSWPDEIGFTEIWPTLAVLGACLMWAIDNNLTRKVSLYDATWIASRKGLVSGSVNLALAFVLGAAVPPLPNLAGAVIIGFFSYGLSYMLFVIGLRHLGTARTGAYFSIAPFLGALTALAMGEPVTQKLIIAGVLMGLGIWLHLTERHKHRHLHKITIHSHAHIHDEHHQHDHENPVEPGESHCHQHLHRAMEHSHTHFPDIHHQHKHKLSK